MCKKNENWLMGLYDLSPKDLARNLDFNLGNALISILSCDSNISTNQKFTAKKDLIMAIEFLKDELGKLDFETSEECCCGDSCGKNCNCKCNCNKEKEDIDVIQDCTYIPLDDKKRMDLHLNSWWILPDLRDTIIFSNSITNCEFNYDITLIYTSKGVDGLPKKNYKLLFSEIESPIGPRLNTKFIIELPFSSDEIDEESLIETIKRFCHNELNENISCLNDLKKVLANPNSIFKFNNPITLKYDTLKEECI